MGLASGTSETRPVALSVICCYLVGGLRTFSWRWSRSHSLALTVLYRTHPTKRPFDALVVVPADVIVDQDEHLVACAFLPMLGIDGFRLHSTEEPLRGGSARKVAHFGSWPSMAR